MGLTHVFTGISSEGEEINLYLKESTAYRQIEPNRLDIVTDEFHIRVDEEERWALSPNSKIIMQNDIDKTVKIEIESPQWTGVAIGHLAA